MSKTHAIEGESCDFPQTDLETQLSNGSDLLQTVHKSPRSRSLSVSGYLPKISAASRVNVDYFDPIGVSELRQTPSHHAVDIEVENGGNISRRNSRNSSMTLNSGGGPFDFEKEARTVMKR